MIVSLSIIVSINIDLMSRNPYDHSTILVRFLQFKMAGYYSAYEDKERGVVYHACVIPDATACCAQGIEFIWRGEHSWPADYPDEGTDIVVTGRLESYLEDGYMYLHLVDSEVKW